MATPSKSKCKRCGADIYWALCKTGKMMPIDVEKSERGNVLLTYSQHDDVIKADIHPKPVEGGRSSHMFTCPHSEIRKEREARKMPAPALAVTADQTPLWKQLDARPVALFKRSDDEQ